MFQINRTNSFRSARSSFGPVASFQAARFLPGRLKKIQVLGSIQSAWFFWVPGSARFFEPS